MNYRFMLTKGSIAINNLLWHVLAPKWLVTPLVGVGVKQQGHVAQGVIHCIVVQGAIVISISHQMKNDPISIKENRVRRFESEMDT